MCSYSYEMSYFKEIVVAAQLRGQHDNTVSEKFRLSIENIFGSLSFYRLKFKSPMRNLVQHDDIVDAVIDRFGINDNFVNRRAIDVIIGDLIDTQTQSSRPPSLPQQMSGAADVACKFHII